MAWIVVVSNAPITCKNVLQWRGGDTYWGCKNCLITFMTTCEMNYRPQRRKGEKATRTIGFFLVFLGAKFFLLPCSFTHNNSRKWIAKARRRRLYTRSTFELCKVLRGLQWDNNHHSQMSFLFGLGFQMMSTTFAQNTLYFGVIVSI